MDLREFDKPTPQEKRRTNVLAILLGLVALGSLLLVLSLTASYSRVSAQERQKEPLGSLSSTGEVYVNNSPAPAESTIFAGDTLRTGETGTATFTVSGKGDLKVSRQSQLVFSDGAQYAAELNAGTIVLDSSSGPTGVTLRAGGFVVVPAVRDQVTSARIDGATNGSFRISSLDGAVALILLDGTSGQILQVGQSVSVSPRGELASPAQVQPVSHTRWILFGLAVAGATAAGGAAAAGPGGGKQCVSPASPQGKRAWDPEEPPELSA